MVSYSQNALIIYNNFINCEIIKCLLQARDFDVVEESDANKGYELLLNQSFKLVFVPLDEYDSKITNSILKEAKKYFKVEIHK